MVHSCVRFDPAESDVNCLARDKDHSREMEGDPQFQEYSAKLLVWERECK